MPKAADPFYTRKPVPDELIRGEHIPGLTQDQAFQTRERKLSIAGPGGSDLRRFSNTLTPKNDPFYSRKPVPDAVIVQTRIDTAPDGMATMASPIAPAPSPSPGVYAFKTDLTMAGRWLLSISAKVQGEPETVIGKVIFRASR